jgi:hypothetical protein
MHLTLSREQREGLAVLGRLNEAEIELNRSNADSEQCVSDERLMSTLVRRRTASNHDESCVTPHRKQFKSAAANARGREQSDLTSNGVLDIRCNGMLDLRDTDEHQPYQMNDDDDDYDDDDNDGLRAADTNDDEDDECINLDEYDDYDDNNDSYSNMAEDAAHTVKPKEERFNQHCSSSDIINADAVTEDAKPPSLLTVPLNHIVPHVALSSTSMGHGSSTATTTTTTIQIQGTQSLVAIRDNSDITVPLLSTESRCSDDLSLVPGSRGGVCPSLTTRLPPTANIKHEPAESMTTTTVVTSAHQHCHSHRHPASSSWYHCATCDIYFGNIVMYTIHAGCHGYHNPLQCNVCGHVARDCYEFASHLARGDHCCSVSPRVNHQDCTAT